MDDTKREELEKACKKEKDHKVRTRMVAVRMVRVLNMSVEETANLQVHCPTWVRDWLRRYDEGGLEGLRDLPRCGRPRRILRNVMDEIIANVAGCRITPMGLQQYIRAQTGTSLHITYVRKIMRLYNLSPKVAQKIHINRANRKAVWNWRYYLKRRISCLEKEGFAVIMQDEAFFVHDTVSGRKYWSPKGRRINVPYTGSHKKVTIYGSLVLDGRQFFRTYERFNAVTFVAYLKELQRHFGKAVLICDRAPQHRSKLVKEFLRKNKNVKIMYFPKGSPYLNAVEECWRQGKRRLLVSEYYRTFSDMCMAISTYYRTARFNLELIKYVNKKTELIHANL